MRRTEQPDSGRQVGRGGSESGPDGSPPQVPGEHPLHDHVDRVLALEPLLRTAAGMVIAALVVCALYFGQDVLVPIALAGFLGFLLDPLVVRLKRWGVPRALAALMVTLAAVLVIAALATYMLAQLRGLSADLPTYQDTIQSKLDDLREQLNAPSAWDGALSTIRVVSDQIEEAAGTRDERGASAAQRVIVAETDVGPARTVVLWMARVAGPAATGGIVMLFVILILIDRDALRDRVLRLMGGGNLHLATDALREAGTRIGRYLRMQLVVNASYGVPMAIGLYLIGVPGAALWGTMAIVLRFMPYLGPLLSGLFPLVLAFAVDPGWSMVLWTIALIVALELITNNVFEPWLYGSSTGLSPLSIVIAAVFWTALWGPVGLILATPLTVCVLVLGRHVPGMGFFETLLGSAPVLDAPNRLYQRLLAGNVVDATELATDFIERRIDRRADSACVAEAITAFYDLVAAPALRLASAHHTGVATVQHRLHFTTGMAELLQELRDEYPAVRPSSDDGGADPRVHCLGARWEVDVLGAQMLAHALAMHGIHAKVLAQIGGRMEMSVVREEVRPGDVICVSVFHPSPQALLRLIGKRLRRLQSTVRVIAVPWTLVTQPDDVDAARLSADTWVGSAAELVHRLMFERSASDASTGAGPADVEAPRQRLGDTGVLEGAHVDRHADLVRQVANAFDAEYAQLGWVDGLELVVSGSTLPGMAREGDLPRLPTIETACRLVVESGKPVVIDDVERDPRVSALTSLQRRGIRFYAGVPVMTAKGGVIGSLCVMDLRPRRLGHDELALLVAMAERLARDLPPSTV